MLNRFIITQTNLDSGSLTVLATVVHRFKKTGQYYGIITKGEKIAGRFSIYVCECAMDQASNIQSLKIDLKSLDQPESQQMECQNQSLHLGLNGYASFFVSTGAGGYSFEIQRGGQESAGEKELDSNNLKEEDLFVATILRPGKYAITNVNNRTKAELKINYPEIGKTKKQSEPAKVECTKEAMTPNSIRINPAQPLLFNFKTPSRIKIELIEPEDRPRPPIENQTQQVQLKSQTEAKAKKSIRHLRLNPS
jgi:hypothetical protein